MDRAEPPEIPNVILRKSLSYSYEGGNQVQPAADEKGGDKFADETEKAVSNLIYKLKINIILIISICISPER